MAKELIHGIALRSGVVEYTTLAANKEAWDISAQQSHRLTRGVASEATDEALEKDAEAPDPHEQLVSQLKPQAHAWKSGLAAVSLPVDRLLLRVVELPTVEPDEIISMVELQIEKFSPFPVDTLTVSYETLAETESSSRVLIVAVKNEVVDELGAVFHELGVTVRWIDVDVLGWWHWLTDKEKISKFGREAVLLHLEDGVVLVVSQNGAPLTVRAIPGLEDMAADEFCETIAEEVDFGLTSLEAEWGGVDHTQYSLWSEVQPSPGFVDELSRALSAPLATGSLAELPPLSHALAERALHHATGQVDLAPPEWEAGDVARATKKNLLVATVGVASLCLLFLAGVTVMAAMQRSGLDRVQQEREAIKVPAADVRSTRDQVKRIQRYIDNDASSLEVLRAISMSLPDGVDLSAFTYNRNGNVTIRGASSEENPIYKFVEKLQETVLFDDVKLDRVENKRIQNVRKSVFRITARLKEMGE